MLKELKIEGLILRHPWVISFFSGILFTLGFAPFFVWPLSMACLWVLMSVVHYAPSKKRAFQYGFMFGFGYFACTLHFFIKAFYMQFQNWWIALASAIPSIIAVSIYLALYVGITALAFYVVRKKWFAALVFAGMWLLGEYVRGVLGGGFPWNFSGYVWANHKLLMQLAAFGQIWLMSAVFLCVSALLWSGRVQRVSAIVLLLGSLGVGAMLYYAPENEGESLSVRLIQPNVEQTLKWKPQMRREAIDQLIEMTLLPRDNPADVIIWPETAVTYFIEDEPYLLNRLQNIVDEKQVLMSGAMRRAYKNGKPQFYNSLYALKASGELDVYDKQILVPFGEYVPLRRFIPSFAQSIAGRLDYTKGVGRAEIEAINGVSFLPMICFEAIYSRFVTKHNFDQNILLTITNDGWFDGTLAPYQHFYMARIRALEVGKPLLRVANTGITAIIDAKGRILERTKMEHVDVLDWDVFYE